MKLTITREEIALLFSSIFQTEIRKENIHLSEMGSSEGEIDELVIYDVPVDKLVNITRLLGSTTTEQTGPTANKGLEEEKVEDETDLLTMSDLHKQNEYLKDGRVNDNPIVDRPLGPTETYEPPGETTDAEIQAGKRFRNG